MIHAALGQSKELDAFEAGRIAARDARSEMARVEGAILLASSDCEGLPGVVDAVCDELGTDRVVGCATDSVLADGEEHTAQPIVAVLALSGVSISSFFCGHLESRELDAAAGIRSALGRPLRANDLAIVFHDPVALARRPLETSLCAALGEGRAVGGAAGDRLGGAPLVWAGAECATGALSGLIVELPAPAQLGVADSCRPVSPSLFVTRVEGNWIHSIDDRPALDVYREYARGPLAADLRRALGSLLVGTALDPQTGHYRAQPVAGFSEQRRALAVPDALTRGDEFAFVLRDPEFARDATREMVARTAVEKPGFSLYFGCNSRGASLFGVEGLEAGYLAAHAGDAPSLGMLGPRVIASRRGRIELLTHAAVMASAPIA